MLAYSPDWSRVSTSTGYKVVYCPGHPRAWSTGYVYVHVIMMEMKLGRLLEKGEIVHHKNEDRMDNSLENLELTSRSKHSSHHSTTGITYVEFKCQCGKTFQRRKGQDPVAKKYKSAYCSRRCNGLYSSKA